MLVAMVDEVHREKGGEEHFTKMIQAQRRARRSVVGRVVGVGDRASDRDEAIFPVTSSCLHG